MLNIYHVNSLVHWEEREIHLRDHMIGFFSQEVRNFLRSVNSVVYGKPGPARLAPSSPQRGEGGP
ncbi:hypothetical protein GFL39_33480 [Rhizobium leguminosarum bv. viciae]|nr:hypothetical protein [Rhizobium leguminosarum]NKL09720.1 hypothetical protein [Rhizobium leguminosarum bv. viciae]NKL91266.1 hypothetical protein [Rhizobium leguminosarum bv. viciae]NKM91589.1 hypothetical protein [Rhizobium leguminosarum bv. viciae]